MGVFLSIKGLLRRRSARYMLGGLGSFGVCLIFMGFTDPGTTSLAMLLVPFFALGVGVYMMATGFMMIVFRSVRLRVRRFIAITASAVLVMLLLLRSLNQFTLKDAAIILVLIGVMALYIVRADFLAEISSNRDNPGV